jgi:hypothetical protein
MNYPWYEILNSNAELQQGDFIPDCPIIIPLTIISHEDTLDIEVSLIDSIVLSQSCDLVNGKIELVLVCPFYPLKKFIEDLPEDQRSKKGIAKIIDNLKKGHLPGYHLLNKYPDRKLLEDYQIVDFKNVYGVQFNTLLNMAQALEERIRLLPPYREHLSQAFARYFMRVGLPQDINVEGY